MLKNKRGQMMLVGILILVMALLIFISMLPAVSVTMDTVRGCSNLNCAGFVDIDAENVAGCSATNQSYLPSASNNALTCTILDLALPLIIMGVLIGLITAILHNRMVEPPQPQYGQYPGQY